MPRSPPWHAVPATYHDTGLVKGTAYFYRVRAYNPAGNSGYSNVASATPGGEAGELYAVNNTWATCVLLRATDQAGFEQIRRQLNSVSDPTETFPT